MKKIPLFYYPTTFLWVDDDKNMLNTMLLFFKKKNCFHSFTSGKECLDFLAHYKSPLLKYNFLKANFQDERYGLAHHLPMDFDLTKLSALSKDKTRHDEITALVVDYKMPAMDGFELARKLKESPIQKILLTGNKNDSKTIEGFNNNLIQRFAQKGTDNLTSILSKHLKELSIQYFQNVSAPLLSYLESEEKLPLSDPTFVDFFETYQNENDITEYYLIDRQGSFFCINSQGDHFFLVVHSERSINNWLDVYSKDPTLRPNDLSSILAYQKIPFLSFNEEKSQSGHIEWSKHLYTSQKLEGREKYFISRIGISSNSDFIET